MKAILSLMVLVPFLSFSQVSHWRSGNTNSVPRVTTPQVHTQPNTNVSQWRSAPPVPQNPKVYVAPTYKTYRYLNTYPYYGVYGYYYTSPYYWYDPYGYRVRGYINHYENGKIEYKLTYSNNERNYN